MKPKAGFLIAGLALAGGALPATPGHAVPTPISVTISFVEGAPGTPPTVSGPLSSVTTAPDFATGNFMLSAPGPGPIEPPGTTAAVLLLDPSSHQPSDLVIFAAGLEQFPPLGGHPFQNNIVSFYSQGAAACPTLLACIPSGVTPGTGSESGALQDISALFNPPLDLLPNSGGLAVHILVQSGPLAVTEPAAIAGLAAGLLGLALLRPARG